MNVLENTPHWLSLSSVYLKYTLQVVELALNIRSNYFTSSLEYLHIIQDNHFMKNVLQFFSIMKRKEVIFLV